MRLAGGPVHDSTSSRIFFIIVFLQLHSIVATTVFDSRHEVWTDLGLEVDIVVLDERVGAGNFSLLRFAEQHKTVTSNESTVSEWRQLPIRVISKSHIGDADLYLAWMNTHQVEEDDNTRRIGLRADEHVASSVSCGLDVLDVTAPRYREFDGKSSDTTDSDLVVGVYGHPSHAESRYRLWIVAPTTISAEESTHRNTIDTWPISADQLYDRLVEKDGDGSAEVHSVVAEDGQKKSTEGGYYWNIFFQVVSLIVEILL